MLDKSLDVDLCMKVVVYCNDGNMGGEAWLEILWVEIVLFVSFSKEFLF
jgi:hypothetical protein